ncbi:hypothetical protein BDZ89DRAFT_320319 [Hymenopellis radicata]|nr:hypothetical protein BDZ89DRAFT_320319 [Hymenopellis radicata]
MAPIRQHHKTRTGCRTCRQRKVKCDERSPVCNNCSRREVECVWTDNGTPPKSSTVGPAEYLPVVVASSSAIDFMNLELMHHFTHYTCLTLQQHPDAVEVWRTVAPSLTFSGNSTFLLHAMLAVSSLHLHTLQTAHDTTGKYAYAAASHRTQAMKELPSASDLPPGSTDYTLFLTHGLLAVYGLARPPVYSSGMTGWIYFGPRAAWRVPNPTRIGRGPWDP